VVPPITVLSHHRRGGPRERKARNSCVLEKLRRGFGAVNLAGERKNREKKSKDGGLASEKKGDFVFHNNYPVGDCVTKHPGGWRAGGAQKGTAKRRPAVPYPFTFVKMAGNHLYLGERGKRN